MRLRLFVNRRRRKEAVSDLDEIIEIHRQVSDLETKLQKERNRREAAEWHVSQLQRILSDSNKSSQEFNAEMQELVDRAEAADATYREIIADLMEENSKPPTGTHL